MPDGRLAIQIKNIGNIENKWLNNHGFFHNKGTF
jgi:hypothetical protein